VTVIRKHKGLVIGEKAMKRNWRSALKLSSQETTTYSPIRPRTDSVNRRSPEVVRPVKLPVRRIHVGVAYRRGVLWVMSDMAHNFINN
jgi:hypothetical protein